MSGRTLMLIFLAVLIMAATFLVLRPMVAAPQPAALPVELKSLIPAGWQVIPDQQRQCDFNNDQQQEWMILYRYDATPDSGLIGGVIFNTDVVTPSSQGGAQSSYLPTLLIPYKLLPDMGPGKGEGYLGETRVAINLYPPVKQGQACRASEIAIFGYSGTDLPPTRLSIFRWAGPQTGYRVAHFAGNARVVTPTDTQTPITSVATYNRLDERSRLCEVKIHERPASATTIDFVENSQRYSIDFCFGAPEDPAYPEGAVVALLRGRQPSNMSEYPGPTGESYLTLDAADSLPPELADLKLANRQPYRILAFATQGSISQPANSGDDQVTQAGVDGKASWWFGPQRVEVQTSIVLRNGQPREVKWYLVGVTSAQVSTDTRWRIEKVELL